ncbi:zinc finger protein 248-like [Branchiostoma floridae]|uniref:Zinc finger protein 248-like n=1 Tax=Branchiostoma floridae TaxID=7739 RepID=A0A9J7M8M1_BRAFL|nr:zinc finger protein 248-like [Branchiostoma floridae]
MEEQTTDMGWQQDRVEQASCEETFHVRVENTSFPHVEDQDEPLLQDKTTDTGWEQDGEEQTSCKETFHVKVDNTDLQKHAAQKISLDFHIASRHSGANPHMCGKCGYSTHLKSNLNNHMRTHMGVKPYKCDQCDFSSAHKSQKCHLDQHLAKHMGEKPYMCGECGYRTAWKSNLSRHMHRNAICTNI